MGVIYLVRHGQANASAYGVADAADDLTNGPGGLTTTGSTQAALTGGFLAGQVDAFTDAVSGDLPRQSQTLSGVLGTFEERPHPRVDPGWNEYSLPALVGHASAEMYHDNRRYQEQLDKGLAAWIAAGEHDAAPGLDGGPAESYPQFKARVADAAARAAALAGSGQTVLVVSSAGTITQLIAQLWGVPDENWPAMARTMVNASITKLIVGRTGVSVVSFNEHGHLSDRDGGVATVR
ncbi:histidine phosphatase family protein [Gordonia sp. zg691]|uniref:Histidine phosphatase family protein n=1 Tax=Gordonia jinghuaiqii TaxID=2758710 RepID=A0A7D7R2N0_9ACTN|nr:histidine phosphatase family protein [Gordonia jinghuaiqii]MBD0860563.1 histidine phosphatase family protein [Gordonia jinghuaiqii]MCR5978172.1 histidine phosphatase family protein [Gordonia jinghuaiqii]QMT01372.1 histidine phosphatase family protein [Gordonia jinghuaiqii]